MSHFPKIYTISLFNSGSHCIYDIISNTFLDNLNNIKQPLPLKEIVGFIKAFFVCFFQAFSQLKSFFFWTWLIHITHWLNPVQRVKKKKSISGSESKPRVFGASRSWKLMCRQGIRLQQIFRWVSSIFFSGNWYLRSYSASSLWKG